MKPSFHELSDKEQHRVVHEELLMDAGSMAAPFVGAILVVLLLWGAPFLLQSSEGTPTRVTLVSSR